MLSPLGYDSPSNLGLGKFHSWRQVQAEALERMAHSSERFVVLGLPTGAGKSVSYMAYAQWAAKNGKRVLILTSTKPLQDQLARDFEGLYADVRGMNNYICNLMPWFNAGNAICRAGVACGLKDTTCNYYSTIRNARESFVVVANYALWLAVTKKLDEDGSTTLGDFDVIVLDEAHEAGEHVMSAMSVTIDMKVLVKYTHIDFTFLGQNSTRWVEWANTWYSTLDSLLRDKKAYYAAQGKASDKNTQEMVEISHLMRALRDIRNYVDERYYIRADKEKVEFIFIEPGYGYAEDRLFLGIPKAILTSATITKQGVGMLGLDPDECDFIEYSSDFPKDACKVVFNVNTPKVDYSAPESAWRAWVRYIDSIIEKHNNEKGIVHVASYDQAQRILKASAHQDKLYFNTSTNTKEVIQRFKTAKAPAVLVSPSVSTGYDFPGDQCRYQVIGKVPFPNIKDEIVKQRAKLIPSLPSTITAQKIIQTAGRGMRSMEDFCVTYIADKNFDWWYKANRHHFPKWFQARVHTDFGKL